MNIQEVLQRATQRLHEAGINSARLDARVLLAHVLDIEPNELISYPPLEGGSKNSKNFSGRGKMPPQPDPSPKFAAQISTLPQGEGRVLSEFEALIARRLAREPVAYLTCTKGFWDLDFAVGPGALVPRPETETLIEEAQRLFPGKTAPLKILDLGTGSGCILLTLLHLYPNATGLGVEASQSALQWARRNAARLNLESRAELRLSDWSAIPETDFDLVVSNPPYLTDADMAALQPELAHEPPEALSGGPDGLGAYRAIAALLPRLLAPNACAILEIGMGQGAAAAAILGAAGLEIAGFRPDLSGIPRCATARMVRPAP